MAISDEIKNEQKKLKGKTPKEKLSYFWDYYKIHTIAAIVSLLVIAAVIRDVGSLKDYAFYAVYMNAYQTFSAEEQMAAFSDYAGIDTETYEALLDNTMYYSLTDMSQTTLATSQKFAAMVHASEIDVAIADEDVFSHYAVNELFYDLRTVLSEEQLAKYEGRIFYVDGAEIEAADKDESYWDYEDDQEYYDDLSETFTDHHDPSVMEDPIPAGIYIGDAPVISAAACYPDTVPVFGILGNTERLDTALKYLDFLFE